MWLTVNIIAHSSFSHHNVYFLQTELSSLNELRILKVIAALSSNSDESSEKSSEKENNEEKNNEEEDEKMKDEN